MHDIYDPPPAPVMEPSPPESERWQFTTGDLMCLVGLCAFLFAAAAVGWRSEPALAVATAMAGALVVLESWLTAQGCMHRRGPPGLRARWSMFVAALVPWLVGVGFAVGAMLSLFWISDIIG